MARPSSIQCRSCGHVPEVATVQYCEECFGPLDVVAGAPAATGRALRARIESGPASMWRYRDLVPFDEPPGAAAVGWTPLVRAATLGAELDLDGLWLKDDTANPSGSFKDRVVAAALGRALAQGATVLACASTGNLAHAAAGAARRAGLTAVVLVPEALPADEQLALAAAGATVVGVAGDYDAANRLASEASMDDRCAGWAWLNIGLRPWYVEGSATVAHEVAEQLGWRLPDHVVAPIASGAMLLALHRAFRDLAAVGLVAEATAPVRLWGAQPAGCAPVADAFAAGAVDVAPVRPATVATSLAMGDPPDGPEVLAAVRATGGGAVAVPERAIGEAGDRLARTERLVVEPAGGVVIGALAQLASEGRFGREETVVACLTGGPHSRWRSTRSSAASAASADPASAMVGGRVAGTIQATVSALSAAVREGSPGSPEEPSR